MVGLCSAPRAVSGLLAQMGPVGRLWPGVLQPPGAAALPLAPTHHDSAGAPHDSAGPPPGCAASMTSRQVLFATLNHLHLCPPTMPIVVL